MFNFQRLFGRHRLTFDRRRRTPSLERRAPPRLDEIRQPPCVAFTSQRCRKLVLRPGRGQLKTIAPNVLQCELMLQPELDRCSRCREHDLFRRQKPLLTASVSLISSASDALPVPLLSAVLIFSSNVLVTAFSTAGRCRDRTRRKCAACCGGAERRRSRVRCAALA
jgi:hypothetical protein